MVSVGPRCWLWTGTTDHLGYGQFRLAGPSEGGRMVGAHRFAWERAYGAIPEGAEVIHRCGERRCVRPDHLELSLPAEVARRPTARQRDLLRAWVRFGMRRGSVKRAAAELGIAHQTALVMLYQMRQRIGVSSTHAAVQWLDEHEPEWCEGSAPAPRRRSL
jgi:hypothetical protein